MSIPYYEADDELTAILSNYGVPPVFINDDDVEIITSEPIDDDEIMMLMNALYLGADRISPTGERSLYDMEILDKTKKELDRRLREIIKEKGNAQADSNAWQAFAENERTKTELSVKREKLEKMNRLKKALENPEIKDLLLKVMNRQLTPQQAFADIKANHKLKEKMMSLTLNGRRGGKSRVFRRKNKKMTSTSKRNVRRTRHTRRHRKSSTRQSTRK
jgi:hypothetical protein